MTAANTTDIESIVQQGRVLHEQGHLEAARGFYQQALRRQPRHFFALYLLGVIANQTDQPNQGVEFIQQAIALNPLYSRAHYHLGLARLALAQYESAIESYDAAIALDPEFAEAICHRGNAYFDMGRYEAAIESFDRAIELRRDYTLARNNRGLSKFCLSRYAAAIGDFDAVIALEPDNAEALNYRGHALRDGANLHAALSSYEAALALRPDYLEALNGRGSTLSALEEYAAALECYDQAIRLEPDFAEGHLNRGNVLKELRYWQGAVDSFSRAIRFKPDLAEAYYGRAETLRHMTRFESAAADFARAAQLKPTIAFMQGLHRHVRMGLCDWDGFEADLAELTARIERSEAASPPFPMLALCDSAALHRRAAEIWVRENCPPDHTSSVAPRYARHDRIRIGYFSADFRNHPVSYLTAELFETHDRSRFEVIAFSLGPDANDEMAGRLKRAFEHYVDGYKRSDQDIATLARAMELDIAIDLGGFTEGSKPRVFANRAAPLQVSYLGYLATMAAPYMDYLIADPIIIPFAARKHYAEKILYLPTYQVNDSKRHIAERPFDREALGLPPRGFVFCCFNTHYKITPYIFAVWMRILGRVPGSILFMHAESGTVERNLRLEASRRGVDAARLVFGDRLPLPEYLSRFRAADLFLDTLPYNAGTTASDALWAGLPVLTCLGETFAGRVAASVLTAVGMPELITTTLEQYEELAVELANDHARLAALTQKLRHQQLTAPLFDTKRFTEHLEAGYSMIYERHQSGEPTDHITVLPRPAR